MKTVQNRERSRSAAAISVLTAALAAMLLAVSCSDPGGKAPKESDAAIIVNGTAVTQKEISDVLDMFRMQQRLLMPELAFENEDGFRRGAARQLATSILMVEEVKAMGWEIPAEVIDSIAENIIARFGGREIFKERIESIGESEESMRKDIAEGILIDSIMSVRSAVDPVSDDEARAFFEANKARYTVPGRVRASHIVFSFNPADRSEDQVENIMKRAGEALARAKAGEDFDKLVTEYSSLPHSGDIGWFSPGELAPDLESAVFSLKKGEISGLVPSGMGIHIIRKTDEEAARSMEFDEVGERIKKTLELNKREAAINNYIDSLLAAADIKFLDATLDFMSAKGSSAPALSD